ncbi:MAG: class I SAM-dependent DNA methyltransferase [Halarcobacter sp.]
MGLDLYSKIEPYLDFQEEIYTLHNEFVAFVVGNDLDNILDIGCGQGFFLECMQVNSKKAFGIDLSSFQIEACKEKGFTNVDCIALEKVKEKFNCATAIFDVINYIPNDQLKKFFEDTAKVLNKDGYFIFDVNSLFGFEEIAQGCITIDLEDKFIAIDANYEDNKLITDLTLFTNEKNNSFIKEQDSITQYYHDKQRIKKLLTKAGFKIEEIKPFNLHSSDEPDKLIYISKKI